MSGPEGTVEEAVTLKLWYLCNREGQGSKAHRYQTTPSYLNFATRLCGTSYPWEYLVRAPDDYPRCKWCERKP